MFVNLLESSRKSFWKFLGGSILFMVLIGLLFLLLIVPGIIFSVYWILTMFVWFNEPKLGFMNSLKKSRELVKGRWWRTLGYGILLMLILAVVGALFSWIIYLNSIVSLLSSVFIIYFLRHMYINYSSRTSNKKK